MKIKASALVFVTLSCSTFLTFHSALAVLAATGLQFTDRVGSIYFNEKQQNYSVTFKRHAAVYTAPLKEEILECLEHSIANESSVLIEVASTSQVILHCR